MPSGWRGRGCLVDWQAMGLCIPISVKVDAYQLQHASFVSNLKRLLARHPLVEPRWLRRAASRAARSGE